VSTESEIAGSAISKATRLLKQQQQIVAELAQLKESVQDLNAEEQEELEELLKASLQASPENTSGTSPDNPGAILQDVQRFFPLVTAQSHRNWRFFYEHQN